MFCEAEADTGEVSPDEGVEPGLAEGWNPGAEGLPVDVGTVA